MAPAPSVASKAVRRRALLCLPPVLAVAVVVAAPASAGTARIAAAAGVPECAADLVGR
jgi:hypothetical protein